MPNDCDVSNSDDVPSDYDVSNGGGVRVAVCRFKAEDSPVTRERYQILLSNGCNVTGLGYTTPSLAIGYRANDKSFLLALHTDNVRKAIVCTRDLVSSWPTDTE